jgi:ABC-type glycerol-3-phosphate transport system substrate-binding protein
MKRKLSGCIVCLIIAMVFAACGKSSGNGEYKDEILTTSAVDQDKIMVTVRVEFGAGQEAGLEEKLEEKFPQADFVLRHDGSSNSLYTMRADLEAGLECDLIFSRRLPEIQDLHEEYLLDLAGEDFVNNYYMSVVDSCIDGDGRLYYLPGPSDVYGIVYDKTLFDENGWEVPHSYSEFVKLLKKIKKKTGMESPIQISMMYPDVFQIIFNTYGYEDAYAGADNFLWLTEYQSGNKSMIGHMEEAAQKFKNLFSDGILSLTDWDVSPYERSTMMYTDHTTAMIVECQKAIDYAKDFAESNGEEPHEVAMMPFWTSDDKDSDYLYSIPGYYMAINKSVEDEGSEKKQLLLDVYAYLSSVEGQKVLLSDGLQMSNIKDVPLEENTFSKEILDTIERGQVISTFYLANGETNKQVERQLLGTAQDMVNGKISMEEWFDGADQTRDEFIFGETEEEEVYGEVKETMTRLETAYTVAQMYQELTDAQIGLCYAGSWSNSTNGHFYKGSITDSSLDCINPNKEPKTELDDPMEEKVVVASMTGETILEILNSEGNKDVTKGMFPYYVAAGLKVSFNPWAEPGSRVLSCELSDGSELNPDETYQVAYYNGSLPDDSIQPESALQQTWKESFLDYLDKKGGVLEKPEMEIELKYE